MNLIQYFYYSVKPLIPRALQLFLRRNRIFIIERKIKHLWPINGKTGSLPKDWKGWPDKKKFALVLTHDIDSARGQDRCLDLMNLEKKIGFRSSFFFVPEDYVVSPDIQQEMKTSGFEVGVHGLKHDGKLFQSQRIFNKNAVAINRYLASWQVSGFRSPCMQHNLGWISKLNILYDASTYDFDPFEPQGGGVETIFPFIVEDRFSGRSYVELPYTLPQDFLLFVLMKKKTTDIWEKKLDWIAQKGGMVLMLTHPDYTNFAGTKLKKEEYPAALYEEFLHYIKSNYAGQYWSATALEMAEFWQQNMHNTVDIAASVAQREKAKTCMVVFSYYPGDVRVRREAEALVSNNVQVDVICLKGNEQPVEENVNGVNVYRLPMQRERKGRLNYIWEYLTFIMLTFLKLTRLHAGKWYKTIHVHNMPDVLVLCALFPKITGAKVLLDLHDPMPELFMTKYDYPDSKIIIRLLKFLERACIGFSDFVITPNVAFRELFISRSCPEDKIRIVMNSPQENIFFNTNDTIIKKKAPAAENKFILMFHGMIAERHGLDTALEALVFLRRKIPNVEFHVYGNGDFVDRFLELRDLYNLHDAVYYYGLVPIETIANKIKTIDIGLIPNKRSPFTEINLPTRIFEYLCLNKPVIVPNTRGILDYFKDDEIFFFEPDNPKSLAGVILNIYQHPEIAEQKIKKGRAVYQQHTWKNEQKELVRIVKKLLAD